MPWFDMREAELREYRIATAEPADLDRALAAAQRGFDQWKRVLAPERSRLLRSIAGLLRQQADSVAAVMTREQGKLLSEARMEVLATAELMEWLAEESRRIYGRVVPSRFADTRTLVLYEPANFAS